MNFHFIPFLLSLLLSVSCLSLTAQNSVSFQPIGNYSWVKKTVVRSPEKLSTQSYVRKVSTQFQPKQQQKIFRRKAEFLVHELSRKFTMPADQALVLKGKPIQPVRKIQAPPLLFKDNSLYNISYSDKSHGFLSGSVISMTEDADHNIWMGTAGDGLVKYDGTYYYQYKMDGLISDNVTDVKYIPSSGLWIGSSTGVAIIRNDSVFVPEFPRVSNSSLDIDKISFDSQKNVWVNTFNKGSLKFNTNKQSFQQFDTSCGLPNNMMHHAMMDKHHHYWFAGKGLVKVEGSTILQWNSGRQYMNDDECLSLLEDADTIWLGTFDNCIFKISPSDTVQLSVSPKFTGRVFNMIKSQGAIWFTLYGGGLVYLRGDNYMIFNQTNGLSGSLAYNLMEDTYHNIWVSTLDHGFSRVNELAISTDNLAPAFLKSASNIRTDNYGNCWYFLNGGGLVKETPSGYELITNIAQSPVPSVRHFMDGIFNADGTVWLASYSYGIARYDKRNITFYYYSSNPKERVVLKVVPGKGDIPWFGTLDYGLIYVKDNTFYHLTTRDGLLTNSVTALYADKDGAVLWTSKEGIQKWSNDTIYDLYLNNKRLNFSAECFHFTADGSYLIGSSDKGLLMMKGNSLYALQEEGYADFHSVNSILEDKSGTFWLTNQQGVMRASLHDLNLSNIKLFRAGNSGVMNTMTGTSYLDEAGIPHWSADQVFLKYRAEFERTETKAPAFSYLHAFVNGAEVPTEHPLIMYPKDELQIHFSIICWGHENQLSKQYLLINTQNADTVRNSLGEDGIVNLNNLSAGNYNIILLASLDNRKYSSASFQVLVKPYWYNTKWFYGVLAIIFIASVFLIFRIRSLRLERAKKILEQKVAQRTADLVASLAQRDVLLKEVHHRVKNNLQVISGLLELQGEEVADEKVKAALSEGQSRVRSVAIIHHNLYKSEDIAFIQFKEFLSDLMKYLSQVFEDRSGKLKVEVTGDAQLDIDTAVPLGLIINELMTNAYKYVAPVHVVGQVKIELKHLSGDQFQLKYQDNGPGLGKNINFDKAETLGLRLIKGLTEQIRGTVTYEYKEGSNFTLTFINKKQDEASGSV